LAFRRPITTTTNSNFNFDFPFTTNDANTDKQTTIRYRSLFIARECLTVIRPGGIHAPDPFRALFSSLLFLFLGGMHCLAWTFPFPTLLEKWAWRTSSIAVAGIIPFAWGVIFGVLGDLWLCDFEGSVWT
jgi:hypothetical protein